MTGLFRLAVGLPLVRAACGGPRSAHVPMPRRFRWLPRRRCGAGGAHRRPRKPRLADTSGRIRPEGRTEPLRETFLRIGNDRFIGVEEARPALGHGCFRDKTAVVPDVVPTLRPRVPPGGALRPIRWLDVDFRSLHRGYPAPPEPRGPAPGDRGRARRPLSRGAARRSPGTWRAGRRWSGCRSRPTSRRASRRRSAGRDRADG